MKNTWDPTTADRIVSEFALQFGKDLAQCVYISRLIGLEPDLVLHGGGNTSVKTETQSILGETVLTLFVKGSGADLAEITPQAFAPMDLERAKKLREISELSQEEMGRQLRLYLLNPDAPMPSVEGFLHAFIPSKFIVHTHPASILALTNQNNAVAIVQKVLGPDMAAVPYIRAGFGLALAAAKAFDQNPDSEGMVLLQHGLVTWGESAEEAYAATIRLVNQAEQYWKDQTAKGGISSSKSWGANQPWENYLELAPIVRGLLAEPIANSNKTFRRSILVPLISPEVLDLLSDPAGQKLAQAEPLTPDHLIRTKSTPLLIRDLESGDTQKRKLQIQSAIEDYVSRYNQYFDRHSHRLAPGARRVDPMPRVLMFPGIGVICAGVNERAAIIARDITEQSLRVKRWFALSGLDYSGIGEEHLFEMEYLLMQQAKIHADELPLERHVAIITGAVGAIGRGITEALLRNGCHVALTDLPGENLTKTAEELTNRYPHQILAVPMDVTDPKSVQLGFREVIRRWGGFDLLIVNAGIAMVSSVEEMDLERFRALERVNVEGTMLVLRETANLFRTQGSGGDIVLISTKNVFAPGVKFGAYSATKAAAHQLARIASLELAELDVRVNMVAPDAVFAHGQTKSGLWAEVGPDRMKARGLDEAGLEEYYKNRNLLKATITAEHVGRAVLFFATRQTPTTGATLPVDGGLPDATPR